MYRYFHNLVYSILLPHVCVSYFHIFFFVFHFFYYHRLDLYLSCFFFPISFLHILKIYKTKQWPFVFIDLFLFFIPLIYTKQKHFFYFSVMSQTPPFRPDTLPFSLHSFTGIHLLRIWLSTFPFGLLGYSAVRPSVHPIQFPTPLQGGLSVCFIISFC